MNQIATIADYIALVCFSAAFLVVLATREIAGNRIPKSTKMLLLGAMGVYVVVALEELSIVLGIDQYVAPLSDNIETLFPVLILGAIFSAWSAAQYEEVSRTNRALQQSADLMNEIVEAAPAGIVFLDLTGHVVFANEAAREILEIREEPDTGGLTSPGWVVAGVDDARGGNLRALVSREPFDGRSVWISWPDGRSVGLHVSGRPLADARDELGGVVISFEHPFQVLGVQESAAGEAG